MDDRKRCGGEPKVESVSAWLDHCIRYFKTQDPPYRHWREMADVLLAAYEKEGTLSDGLADALTLPQEDKPETSR